MLVLWPSAQGGFGSIVADTTGGEGRKAGGQSPWRGHSPPHSLLPFLWSVPDPLRGLWSQNRVSKTTKNLKMAAQLNQELSPAELGVCGVAQEAGLHRRSLGLACCWLAGKRRREGPGGFSRGALTPAAGCPCADIRPHCSSRVSGGFGCPCFPAPPAEKELPSGLGAKAGVITSLVQSVRGGKNVLSVLKNIRTYHSRSSSHIHVEQAGPMALA